MTRARQPYNPVLAEYQRQQAAVEDLRRRDRRATSFSRGIVSHLAPIEVDNPDDPGEQIVVTRNTRNDPLAGMHARHFIDEAQYQAGRAFQSDFETAERGPRAIDPGKEAVDGGRLPEPITEAQRAAIRRLAHAHKVLGQDGSALAADVLIHLRNISQVVARRGFRGGYWRALFGQKLKDCLDKLAVCYGLASEQRQDQIKPRLHPLLQRAIDEAARNKV